MKHAFYFLAIGLAGALAADRLDIPAGLLIGAMVAVAIVKLAGFDLGKVPLIYDEGGKILLGTVIGATFNRRVLLQLGALLPSAIAATLAMIATGLILGWLLSELTRLDLATGLFSLTPGGIAEMIAVAQEIGAHATIVATLQFLRLSSVVILAPAIIHWLFS
ncbi:MAG: AbrB family transcriptional regulator [Anaerolineae bacterium]